MQHARRLRSTLVVALLLGSVPAAAGTAAAFAPVSIPPLLAATPTAKTTPATTARQKEQTARRLREQAAELAEDLILQRAELAARTAAANAALSDYQLALDDRRNAAARSAAAQASQREAEARSAAAKDAFNAFVVMSFQSGGMGDMAGVGAVLEGQHPGELVDQLSMIEKVNEHNAAIIDDMRRAQLDSDAALIEAEQAAAGASDAEAAAVTAKATADELVKEQTDALQTLADRLSAAQSSANRATDDAVAARAAEEAERQRKLAEERARAERLAKARAEAKRLADERRKLQEKVGAGIAACGGGNLDGFANGFLPLSALCPVWGTSGHVLRSDAAAAFNVLSEKYAAEFGSPICVTDSYRDYAMQVDVKRRKPDLAATPGTSNHGWGRAVDLCGGIETDSTVANNWLRVNAPAVGWFHPTWADSGGGGPYEPWHWEYVG